MELLLGKDEKVFIYWLEYNPGDGVSVGRRSKTMTKEEAATHILAGEAFAEGYAPLEIPEVWTYDQHIFDEYETPSN